jgi:hypothetical protein
VQWIFDKSDNATGHILGAALMRPFHNVFDREGLRYGFAPLRDDSCKQPASAS